MPKRANYNLPAVQERRARVVELRSKGMTWDAIASETGYSNASAASKAWKTAIAERPALAVDQIREEAATRYEYLLAETVKDIENPGPAYSAIGRLIIGEDGNPVPNRSVRTRAIDQARKLVTDYVRVNGAEHASQNPGFTEDAVRVMAEVIVARRDRALTALPPAPADYATMTPEEQMQADLARHRGQLAAAPLDIVEAEIVPD